ncbi:hypothetical protein [Winogradskyella vidalii]|uniref:hypothetical protein n=1 Tax=Winogradskyella vidalii TaxID=2615024 RepID=UPI0015CE3AAB|nr:hypothetical protein [Winogradskyella vidalii]
MYSIKIARVTFALLLFIGLLSCASKQQTQTAESAIEAQPKLLFLNFEIEKINDKKSVTLINQITTDGQLKGRIKKGQKPNLEDLECLVLDKDYNVIEKHPVNNPLKKIIEFVNDSGNLEKKILDVDRAEFSLKLQLHPHAQYIQINEITATGTLKHCLTEIQ